MIISRPLPKYFIPLIPFTLPPPLFVFASFGPYVRYRVIKFCERGIASCMYLLFIAFFLIYGSLSDEGRLEGKQNQQREQNFSLYVELIIGFCSNKHYKICIIVNLLNISSSRLFCFY